MRKCGQDRLDPVVRFETPPGLQAQVDFAEFRLPGASASRCWWCWDTRACVAAVLSATDDGSADARPGGSVCNLWGVPAELLFDQMKAVIIEDHREFGGKLLENIEFVRFAAHWDFRIRACRPYRARTKGKVERPIRYVRESFFYGRTVPQRRRSEPTGPILGRTKPTCACIERPGRCPRYASIVTSGRCCTLAQALSVCNYTAASPSTETMRT